MERRDVIKGLAAAAGVFCVDPQLSAFAEEPNNTEKAPFAVPIRGLAKKNGKLQQPVQLKIECPATGATCITRIDRQEVDRRTLSAGTNVFQVYVSPVDSARAVQVECEVAGRSVSAEVRLEPVRKLQIFILPHSHHDLGYTDLQANVE